MLNEERQHDEVWCTDLKEVSNRSMPVKQLLVGVIENQDRTDELHLYQALWMVHKVGVLHLIKRICLPLPLSVQLYLFDVSNYAPLKPLNGLRLLNEFRFLFIFLYLSINLVIIFGCKLDFELDTFDLNCSLLINIFLLAESINVDLFLSIVEDLSHYFVHQV